MAGTGGGQSPGLIQELLDAPHEFDFFQAVRLIEQYVAQLNVSTHSGVIGGDDGPHREPVKFRAMPSLSFPGSDVARLTPGPDSVAESDDQIPLPLHVTVAFMGLTGPNGVLPQHYTTLLIERAHLSLKDHTLREFFDLFNHRLVSLFYRAWEKYRLPVVYERNLREGHFEDDVFTQSLFSLSGLQAPGLRNRFPFDDQAMVFFGGLLAQRSRNAVGLEQILNYCFNVSSRVLQFVGQWLQIPEHMQSSLPSRKHRNGLNLTLGDSAVIGARTWHVQSRIRIQLGPLSRVDFDRMLPNRDFVDSLVCLTQFYIGAEIEFDLQLILHRDEIPPCRLMADGSDKPRLGWNTWLPASQRSDHACEAVFRL